MPIKIGAPAPADAELATIRAKPSATLADLRRAVFLMMEERQEEKARRAPAAHGPFPANPRR